MPHKTETICLNAANQSHEDTPEDKILKSTMHIMSIYSVVESTKVSTPKLQMSIHE